MSALGCQGWIMKGEMKFSGGFKLIFSRVEAPVKWLSQEIRESCPLMSLHLLIGLDRC